MKKSVLMLALAFIVCVGAKASNEPSVKFIEIKAHPVPPPPPPMLPGESYGDWFIRVFGW